MEVLDEVATDVVPVAHETATRLVQSLCGGRLVTSARGLLLSQVDAVARTAAAVSALVAEREGVVEVPVETTITEVTCTTTG